MKDVALLSGKVYVDIKNMTTARIRQTAALKWWDLNLMVFAPMYVFAYTI